MTVNLISREQEAPVQGEQPAAPMCSWYDACSSDFKRIAVSFQGTATYVSFASHGDVGRGLGAVVVGLGKMPILGSVQGRSK